MDIRHKYLPAAGYPAKSVSGATLQIFKVKTPRQKLFRSSGKFDIIPVTEFHLNPLYVY